MRCPALALPLLLLALAGCDRADAPSPAGQDGPPPARVEVQAVRDGDLDEAWTTLGEVVPLARAELAAGATGPVSAVPRREGDLVAEGDVLLVVDNAPAEARWQAARAALAQAEAELDKARRDLERIGAVSSRVLAASERDAVETRVATLDAARLAAQAQVLEAKVALDRHTVRAPFPGAVTGRHTDPGDWITEGSPAIDLVSDRAVEVHVDATWELASRVSPGDVVTILSSDRASSAAGQVVAVVPALDPVTRTSRVRLAPSTDPPPDWLRPGAPVEARFQVTAQGPGVVVPRDALVLAPGKASVVRVDQGTAQHLDVVVVATGDDEALVRAEGLLPGDQVVTRGNERVRPGQALVIEDGI